MSVKIILTKETDPEFKRDIAFEEDTISIGRDAKNILLLESPLVSKAHAKIERKGQSFSISDLKSTNSTFLNDEKLAAGRPYALKDGDRIKVGEFRLEFLLPQRAVAKEAPRRAVESEAAQQYAVDATPLLSRIVEQYKNPEFIQKRVELKRELLGALKQLESTDVQAILEQLDKVQNDCRTLQEENRQLKERLAARGPFVQEPVIASLPVPPPVQLLQTDERTNKVVDILMQAMVRLITGRLSFCTEFLNVTMVQQVESEPLYAGSVERAKKFLLDGSISEKDAEKRRAILKQAVDEVMFHVVGLLDGYRKSVSDGTRKLLQRIDPDVLWSDAMGSKLRLGPLEIPYRFLPLLSFWKWMKLYQKRHAELMAEDRSVIENSVFRPGFINGYRLPTISRKGDLGDDD